jgi:hypothetical protein
MQPELKPVRTDNQGFGRGTSYEPAQDVAYSTPESQKVLRNTYLLLALTMVPTVIGAYIGMANQQHHHGEPDHQLAGDAGPR